MKNSTTRTSLRKASVFVAALCAVGAAHAAVPRISANVESEPLTQMTPAEHRAVSLAAGRILRHAYDANVEIDTGEREMAAEEVGKAKKLVGIIEAAVPDTKRKYRISAGNETYEDSEIAAPEIIPIFTELDRVSLMAPLQDAKAEKDRDALAKDHPEAVIDESLNLVKTTLDFNTVKSGLNRADAALKSGDTKRAREALLAVLGSVRFSVVMADLPLERAQDNLMLAKSELDRGNKLAAKDLLAEAADEIDSYTSHGSPAGTASQKKVRDEIKGVTNKLDDDKGTLTAKIENWWDQIETWMR